MKVIRCLSLGYCLGVEQTIADANKTLSDAEKANLPAYSYGELIHNPDIVRNFESGGLKIIQDSNAVPGIVLIRAHGISKEKENEFKTKGFIIIDSTCKKITAAKQRILQAVSKGRSIIVVGSKGHAEVRTLLGVDETPKYFISSCEDVESVIKTVSSDATVSVAIQSTFSEAILEKIKVQLNAYFDDIEYLNGLCSVCAKRKKEASALAEKCNLIVVVGGNNSSNTTELAKYIETRGTTVIKIENTEDFNSEMDMKIKKYNEVGVCSGTSTPPDVIDAVCAHLESL